MMSVDRLYINHQILIETSVIRNLFQLDGVILSEILNSNDGGIVAISNRFTDCNLLLSLSSFSSTSASSSCMVDVIINYEDIPSSLIDLALNQLFAYENGKSDNCNGILAILKYVKGSLTTIHFAMENQLSGGVCSGSPRSLADTEWRVVSSRFRLLLAKPLAMLFLALALAMLLVLAKPRPSMLLVLAFAMLSIFAFIFIYH